MHKLSVLEMHRLSVEAFKEAPKLPLVMVLDDIRSVYNVGSIFRTADAFRLSGLMLCGITGCPQSVEIHKTALGAEDAVAWKYYKEPLDAIHQLHAEGYTILAVEQVEGSTMLTDWHIADGKVALVMGNEVKGVRQEVVDACDGCLEIPQYGTKHSLNVSCTASIVMWEYLRQHMEKKK